MKTTYPYAEEYLKRFPVEKRNTETQSFGVIKDLVMKYAIPCEDVSVQEICDACGHIDDVRTVHALQRIYQDYNNTPTHYTADIELPRGEESLLDQLGNRWTKFILTGEWS